MGFPRGCVGSGDHVAWQQLLPCPRVLQGPPRGSLSLSDQPPGVLRFQASKTKPLLKTAAAALPACGSLAEVSRRAGLTGLEALAARGKALGPVNSEASVGQLRVFSVNIHAHLPSPTPTASSKFPKGPAQVFNLGICLTSP